jgi:hypothetical protein
MIAHAARRAFIAGWVVVGLLVPIIGPIVFFRRIFSLNAPLAGGNQQQQAYANFLENFGLLILLIVVDLSVLWILQHWMRPVAAAESNRTSFQASFKGFGGAVVATASGVLGSFFTILAALVATLLILAHVSH